MTDDLVKRLRKWASFGYGVEASDTMFTAASRIEKLEAELHSCFHRIEELQAALRGVIAVADRDAPEFRSARKALDAK